MEKPLVMIMNPIIQASLLSASYHSIRCCRLLKPNLGVLLQTADLCCFERLEYSLRKEIYHRVKADGSLQLSFHSKLASQGHSFGNPIKALSCPLQLTALHHLQPCLVSRHPFCFLLWIKVQSLLFPVLQDCLLQPLIPFLGSCFTVNSLQSM